METKNIKKKWRQNSNDIGGAEQWNEWFVQIILDLLSDWTPPSCIPANILTIVATLHPNVPVVQLLSRLSFVRECRQILAVVTKTIAAHFLAKAECYKQLFSDGTSHRQTMIQNVVLSILTGAGYKVVTLSSDIIPNDENI